MMLLLQVNCIKSDAEIQEVYAEAMRDKQFHWTFMSIFVQRETGK